MGDGYKMLKLVRKGAEMGAEEAWRVDVGGR